MTKKQLEELLADMSFEEKIGQLTQLAGSMYGADAIVTGLLGMFKINEKALEISGSVLSVIGSEAIKKLQDENMAKQPHHIPQIFMYDVINGYKTIYPVPLAQGATFNPELVEKLANMSAKESAAAGVHVTFSPMVDLVRDARWGRVMESTGEDPYLNGIMGAAMVKGYQGDDVSKKGNIAACVKHFAGYGGAEAGRDYDNVELSERTLKDDYLPSYKACIDAGAKLVMTSFNTLNRVPSTGNKWLMKNILRNEMGFDGVLISDYGAVKEMINHGYSKDEKQAAESSIKATLDMEMMSTAYISHLKELVDEGKVSIEMIDEAVMRLLILKNDLGLFENPYKDGNVDDEKAIILCDSHRELARESACESFVLLKNEKGTLPLSKDTMGSIAFIGPYADEKRIHGSWSFPDDYNTFVSIKEGMDSLNLKANLSFNMGAYLLDEDKKFKDGSVYTVDSQKKSLLLKEAVEAAKKADTVVMCLGEHFMQTGEASSRTSLSISNSQLELLRKVHEVNDNIITLVFAGRPIELEEIASLSKAVLYVWFPGVEGGNAIADVLLGTNEPGGRLPMSFSYKASQLPNYYNRFNSGRPNNGTLEQGFVLGYIDQADLFMYPFGFGLSYSTFEYGSVSLSTNKLTKGHCLTASVSLKNTGKRTATETVQMYIQDLFGSVVRPRRELKGFKKVTLKPDESITVSFEISEGMLKFHDIEMNYVAEPGDFKVYIGPDSQTYNFAEFELI